MLGLKNNSVKVMAIDILKWIENNSKHLQGTQEYEFIYIDKTDIDTHSTPQEAQKVYDKVSGKCHQRVSLVAGQIGNKAKNLIAPLIIKTPW